MPTIFNSARFFAAWCVFALLTAACFQLTPAAAQETDDEKTSTELVQEIFQDAQGNAGLKARYERLVTNPISPPDTRSPRATLESFLVIMQTASELWLEVRDSYFDGETFFMTKAQSD